MVGALNLSTGDGLKAFNGPVQNNLCGSREEAPEQLREAFLYLKKGRFKTFQIYVPSFRISKNLEPVRKALFQKVRKYLERNLAKNHGANKNEAA